MQKFPMFLHFSSERIHNFHKSLKETMIKRVRKSLSQRETEREKEREMDSSVKLNKQQHTVGSQSRHSKSVLVFVREDGKNEYLPCGINFLFNVLQEAFGKCPATQMYVNTIHNLFS